MASTELILTNDHEIFCSGITRCGKSDRNVVIPDFYPTLHVWTEISLDEEDLEETG
jgi:hypothetical protein